MAKSKFVRMVVSVPVGSVQELISSIVGDMGGTVTVGSALPSDTEAEPDITVDAEEPIAARKVAKRQSALAPRLVGRVLYTPMGTAKQITRLLETLRGSKTVKALVLRDLAKHPGSTNREVRERIAADAKKYAVSVESVDNVIWKLTKDGVVGKRAEA